jgi:peptidoglycan hydrolase CwlO-like protein
MINLREIDNNVLAALAAGGGAVFVKIVEKWASKRNDSFSEGERIRSELRHEIDKLKAEIVLLKKEADVWRTKYWESVEKETTDEHKIEELQREIKNLRDIIKSQMVEEE